MIHWVWPLKGKSYYICRRKHSIIWRSWKCLPQKRSLCPLCRRPCAVKKVKSQTFYSILHLLFCPKTFLQQNSKILIFPIWENGSEKILKAMWLFYMMSVLYFSLLWIPSKVLHWNAPSLHTLNPHLQNLLSITAPNFVRFSLEERQCYRDPEFHTRAPERLLEEQTGCAHQIFWHPVALFWQTEFSKAYGWPITPCDCSETKWNIVIETTLIEKLMYTISCPPV